MTKTLNRIITFTSLCLVTLCMITVFQHTTASAYECSDGTNIADNTIPSFISSPEDIAAFKDSVCKDQGHGGLMGAAPVPCKQNTSFLGFPYWYKYLRSELSFDTNSGTVSCNIMMDSLMGVWLIVAAIIEILLRVAALVAVGFIIYGGVLYILSQSQPDKVKQALKTTINAVVGLVIAIIATALVSFIAGTFN